MGRVLMYTVLAALTTFVLGAAFLLQHGGGAIEAAAAVSVHDLSVDYQLHVHQRVSTEGVLRRIEEPKEHFVITADGLGIVIRRYDLRELRRLEGRTVRVNGRAGFDEATGVFIDAESVVSLK